MEAISNSTQNRQNGFAQKPSFVVFNKATEKPVKYGKPSINFSTSGTVTIYSTAALQLGLTADNCRLEFLQDNNRPKDWYVRLAFHDDAFTARVKDTSKKGLSNYLLNAASFCKAFLQSLSWNDKSITLPLAPEPIIEDGQPVMFAILTAAASAKK